MTDQEIYELLINTDYGYKLTEEDYQQLSSVTSITWRNIEKLPRNLGLLKSVTNLDLSGCGLLVDISALCGLTALKTLCLSQCYRLTDISALSGLMSLTNLDLSKTSIRDIRALSGLKALTSLNLRKTSVSDISALSGLKGLTNLDLSETSIRDIRALSGLTALKNLDLSGIDVSDISALSGLTALSSLILGGTYEFSKIFSDIMRFQVVPCERLTDISAISSLTALTKLRIIGCTNLTDISALTGLKSLTYLDLSGCGLLVDISALCGLTALKTLCLSQCYRLTDISALSGLMSLTNLDLSDCYKLADINALSILTGLKYLYLERLHISKIPESLVNLGLDFYFYRPERKNPGIYIYGTILDDQPIEIFHQDRETILAYFKSQKNGSSPVNQCKVVFLGDGGAGKTLIINRLMHDGEKPEDFTGESTPGVYISSKRYQIEDEKIELHFWDFGGQEIMHSMHRLFLTNRTLYVVVANARDNKANGQAWYWIRNIKSFANGAPVLLVINQKDQYPGVSVNMNGLENDYPALKDVKIISALKDSPDEFNREIRDTICRIVSGMDSVHTLFARTWLSLMKNLQDMEEDCITSNIFHGMCRKNGIETSNRVLDEIINWYRDLGVCFYSRINPFSEQYLVLKPRWLLNAIYILVFNGRQYATNGVICEKDIYKLILVSESDVKVRKVWNDIKYEPFQVHYIIEILLNFELMYRLERGKHQGGEYFFIPMLCDENEPKTIGAYESDEEAVHVSFRYEYLPENILHRLMVRRGDELNLEMVWRTGVVFEQKNCKWHALVRIKDNALDVYVKAGNQDIAPANVYLDMIRENVYLINSIYGLTAEEFISYRQGEKEDFFDYETLNGSKEAGLPEIYSKAFRRRIPIDEILGITRKPQDTMTQDVIEIILSALADMSIRCVDFEDKGEEEITRDVEAAIKQILNDKYQIQIAREYTMGRAKKKIGETDLYLYRQEEGKTENLYILENKNMHTFDFKKQYGQLIGYLNPDFTAGITLSINKNFVWELAFDKIESKLLELKGEGKDFAPINIIRKMTVNRTLYIKSEHIVAEPSKLMPIYHLVLQISGKARQEAAWEARQR